MMETKLRRVLHLDDGDRRSEVVLEIGYPVARDEDMFGCHVSIKGHSTLDFDNLIFGVDPLQAMTLAIRFADRFLSDSELYKSGKLYWLDGTRFEAL